MACILSSLAICFSADHAPWWPHQAGGRDKGCILHSGDDEFRKPLKRSWGPQVAQQSRIRLPMQETQEIRAQSLCQEDLLEKEMATHSSILAWEILWTEKAGGLQSMGLQRVRHNWACSKEAHKLKERYGKKNSNKFSKEKGREKKNKGWKPKNDFSNLMKRKNKHEPIQHLRSKGD